MLNGEMSPSAKGGDELFNQRVVSEVVCRVGALQHREVCRSVQQEQWFTCGGARRREYDNAIVNVRLFDDDAGGY
jgi:hypothetical protein